MRRNTKSDQPPPDVPQRERLVRPPQKTFWEKVRDFIWDTDKKTCFTRSPINWLSITVYYLIFVGVVVFILFLSLVIAQQIAGRYHDRPQYLLGDSPIGTSPPLNYFPMHKSSKPLIWMSRKFSYQYYVEKILDEFDKYKEWNQDFSTKEFGECAEAPFGYDKKTPCIFLRLNRIIMWKPQPYQKGDALPKDVPESVKSLIESSTTPKVWVACQGSTAKDRDHLTEAILRLQGDKGFDASKFPFDGQKSFEDPIVALKINDSANKILYQFTCYAYAKELDKGKTAVDVNYYIE